MKIRMHFSVIVCDVYIYIFNIYVIYMCPQFGWVWTRAVRAHYVWTEAIYNCWEGVDRGCLQFGWVWTVDVRASHVWTGAVYTCGAGVDWGCLQFGWVWTVDVRASHVWTGAVYTC